MKISVNSPCLCGSKQKYKKCCKPYHDGIFPKTALQLMRSRYSAYALKNPQYIINTTHPLNDEYKEDTKDWYLDICSFCDNTDFKGLEILDSKDDINESFVTFKANLEQDGRDISFCEKSKFLKVDGRWLYHSGEFIE